MYYEDSQEAFSLDVVNERLKGLKFASPTAPVVCEFVFFPVSVSWVRDEDWATKVNAVPHAVLFNRTGLCTLILKYNDKHFLSNLKMAAQCTAVWAAPVLALKRKWKEKQWKDTKKKKLYPLTYWLDVKPRTRLGESGFRLRCRLRVFFPHQLDINIWF